MCSLKSELRRDILLEFSKHDNADNIQHPIHPEVDIMYNSLNIFCGQRGTGKTFNAFNIAALISRIYSKFHLFIFISDNPNDETFIKFKPLIEIPILLVSYKDSEECLTELIKYKQAYDEVKEKHLENRLTPKCSQDILSHLYINDFDAPSLHTLILYDDALEVFKNPSSKSFRLLLENRHNRFTYIMNIQDWKGIGTELKANIDSVWLFGGYPRNRFTYIYNQLACPVDRDELWDVYSKLKKREALILTNSSRGTTLKILESNGNTEVIYCDC